MEPIYSEKFEVTTASVDRFGRLKPSWILYYTQQVAGVHCRLLQADLTLPEHAHLFWAVIRHRVQVTRLPREKEVITVETWPMPTTRTAFPRCVIARDALGNELFRVLSLWVLMDKNTRKMVLPGKSGVDVPGLVRGNELAPPSGLMPKPMSCQIQRFVGFSELDINGHVNNTRYLDWIFDLLPSDFHRSHEIREFTVCYLSEAMEGESLELNWELSQEAVLQVDSHRMNREKENEKERVFSAQLLFESGVL